MSISTVLGYRWDGSRSRLFFQTRKGSYNTESLIAFLEDLRRELRGHKVILVWDGLPAHKSRAMQDYLHEQRDWLTVERLPGYALAGTPGETGVNLPYVPKTSDAAKAGRFAGHTTGL